MDVSAPRMKGEGSALPVDKETIQSNDAAPFDVCVLSSAACPQRLSVVGVIFRAAMLVLPIEAGRNRNSPRECAPDSKE